MIWYSIYWFKCWNLVKQLPSNSWWSFANQQISPSGWVRHTKIFTFFRGWGPGVIYWIQTKLHCTFFHILLQIYTYMYTYQHTYMNTYLHTSINTSTHANISSHKFMFINTHPDSLYAWIVQHTMHAFITMLHSYA